MSLGNWGVSLLKDAVGGFFGNDYLRDFTHASKTFRTNSYENAPKLKFLFHTYFEINTQALASATQTNYGLLVKDIKLPSFTVQSHKLNQYNRKRIVQTKIQYDPIEITFHDDGGDNINQLWEAYYTYYYNDSSVYREQFAPGIASNGKYNNRNIYDDNIAEDSSLWGFTGGSNEPGQCTVANPQGIEGKKVPFFKNITVYGFNQHNFTAYTLVNPIITNFSHDTYNYAEGGGVMQNKMTIDYETVVYNYGALDGTEPGNLVPGFGDPATYDNTPSPIMRNGSNATILGRGGLVDAAGGTLRALSQGNILGAIRTAGTAYNTFKNTNLKTVATTELNSMLRNSAQNTPNTRNSNFSFPIAGSTPGTTGTAGYPTIGAGQDNIIWDSPRAGTQDNGSYYAPGVVNTRGVQTDLPFNPTTLNT